MRLDIRYRSTFVYDDVVSESQNELRACPIDDEFQNLVDYRVSVSPGARVLSFSDYWGTRVDTFGHRSPHVALEVLAEATVDTLPRPLPGGVRTMAMLSDPTFVSDHAEYLERTPHCDWDELVATTARDHSIVGGDDVVSVVLALHRLVGARVRYERGATRVGISVGDVLAGGRGVCQDQAHLAVALCRSLGIPARYVSGYLFTRDETSIDDSDDPVLVQTHAWFEAAIPGWGWLALDPTNQQPVGERHVKIGHGRDYDDVQPLKGVFSGAAEASLTPTVEIRRVADDDHPGFSSAVSAAMRQHQQ